MEIAIQGHPTRGKEVIQLLESLGGINKWNHTGECVNYAYYIDHCNNIYSFGISGYHGDRKIYTLEEFEKEFPFKIGDIVLIVGTKSPNKIIALELCMNRLCYKLNNGLHYDSETLKPYKEMKEERNVTLTLHKAKEWYKKGGELKEIALQAFTEKELNSLPRSWEELCRKYEFACLSTRYSNFPLKYDALFKLEQLRDCWRQGWEPIWDVSQKYCIYFSHNEIGVRMCTNASRFLTFPTREMAEEFLECFRDLIEKAGDLI